jgi:hypothetical protein
MGKYSEDLEHISNRVMNIESLVAHLAEVWVPAVQKFTAENDRLKADCAALRTERVQLQAENESLRNDLAGMPASGVVLDDRDRELLRHAAEAVKNGWCGTTGQATLRLLHRLAGTPVEEDEHARMEDEGGPAPTEADMSPASELPRERVATYYGELLVGDVVTVKTGAKTFGGYAFPNSDAKFRVAKLTPGRPHGFTARIVLAGERDPAASVGFWVQPGDLVKA